MCLLNMMSGDVRTGGHAICHSTSDKVATVKTECSGDALRNLLLESSLFRELESDLVSKPLNLHRPDSLKKLHDSAVLLI